MDNDFEANLGISRRTVIKRGAIVGGTLMWAAPAVRTMSRAGAQTTAGSPGCTCTTVSVVCQCPGGVPTLCFETQCACTPASAVCACGCVANNGIKPQGCPSCSPQADLNNCQPTTPCNPSGAPGAPGTCRATPQCVGF